MWVTFDWFAEAIVDKSEFNVFFMQGHLWCVRWLWRHRVAFRLCFKASCCAKPLMWKSVLFTCKWTTVCFWIELISTWTASYLDALWTRGERQLGNCLLASYGFISSILLNITWLSQFLVVLQISITSQTAVSFRFAKFSFNKCGNAGMLECWKEAWH